MSSWRRSEKKIQINAMRTRTTSPKMGINPSASFEESCERQRDCQLERVNPRHRLANDQSVDVVRALVGLNRLEVCHVAEDGVFVRHPVRAQNVAGHACTLQSHPDIVALSHRDVLVAGLVLIFETADLQHE